ncbi:piRNA biogenesis protein EXD1-like [Mytilus californianus]|uniref:piRNA biogenesis protein EXD1-like n=1 Tax=Mytilus californianus TaxID=6549 RepID=UPI002245C3F7|nr:piRNA biogenesis protein EXD1-like [Mytilus californianus]
MATKRKSEPDDEDQQQQSDGPTSNKKLKHHSASSDTSVNESNANDTNDSNTENLICIYRRESAGEITQSGPIHLRNSEPDNENQQQQSDGSTSNENNTSDSNAEDVLYRRESAGEITQSRTIQVGINETSSYKYIDTKEKYISAINELNNMIKDGKTISLDCEGVDLSRFGCVTMVNIGTRDMVYLIDVLRIGNSVFDDGLRCILENNSIEKLMFDCREDADALFHLYKVKLDGVLDVQLLEARNRMKRKRHNTLLASLETCLESFPSNSTLLRLKKQGRQIMLWTTKIWEKRPLSESMLKYAAVDVLGLFHVYDKFRNIMPHNTWKAASSLYCDNKRSRARTHRDGDALLPTRVRDIIL